MAVPYTRETMLQRLCRASRPSGAASFIVARLSGSEFQARIN